MRFIDELDDEWPDDIVTVVMPEFVVSHWWEQLLHNQSALVLKARLRLRPNTVVTAVPVHLYDQADERLLSRTMRSRPKSLRAPRSTSRRSPGCRCAAARTEPRPEVTRMAKSPGPATRVGEVLAEGEGGVLLLGVGPVLELDDADLGRTARAASRRWRRAGRASCSWARSWRTASAGTGPARSIVAHGA